MQKLFTVAVLMTSACVASACNGVREDTSQPVEIVFTSQPDPLETGENTFQADVKRGAAPVTDAAVLVELYMAAMPEIKMPEMRTSVPLNHEGAGRYRGKGDVAMAGMWDATVKVSRGGQEIGTRKFTVTAK